MSKHNKAVHSVEVVYDITTTNKNDGKVNKREHSNTAFSVEGGKVKIRKAIEEKHKEIHDALGDKYESTLDEFKVKRLYIDAIKQDLHEFKEISNVWRLVGVMRVRFKGGQV
jgi:predicted metalloendopeptidase